MDNQNDPSNIPTLADIVRRQTNNGALIVGFYLDVVEGTRDEDGFEACHRMEAAAQLQAVAPDLVAEFIEVISGEKCVHAQRRSPKRIRRRKPRDPKPVCAGDCRSHNRHEAIEYLASALDAPSITDDPRVTGIVRASTDHGKVAVSYLINVMNGAIQGFGPHHRMRAAQELIAHIARDELRTQPDPAEGPEAVSGHPEPVEGPVLSTAEGSHPDSTHPDPAEGPAEVQANPSVIPAEAGIQEGEDADGPLPSNNQQLETNNLPQDDAAADASLPTNNQQLKTNNQKLRTRNLPHPCYSLNHKIARSMWQSEHPIHNFIQAYDELVVAFLKEGDDDQDEEYAKRWIAGLEPDRYGKLIYQYCPYSPTPIRKPSRPRRQSRPTPATESIRQEMTADRLRREGKLPPPKRTLLWV